MKKIIRYIKEIIVGVCGFILIAGLSLLIFSLLVVLSLTLLKCISTL